MVVSTSDIVDYFKRSQYRMRIFGVPLQKQKTIKLDNDGEVKQVDDHQPAQAIQVKIFASDLQPLIAQEPRLLSLMYARTFVINN